MPRIVLAQALAGLHETSDIPRGSVMPRVLFVVDFAFRSQAAILDFATCVAIASINGGDRQS